MGNDEISFMLATAAVLAVALVLPLVLLSAVRREREQRLALSARLKPMGEQIQGATASLMGLAERLGRLERLLEQQQRRLEQTGRWVEELRLKQDQFDRGSEPPSSSYVQAVKLAERGASAEELIELCGLTRGEAELVSMMHRAQREDMG